MKYFEVSRKILLSRDVTEKSIGEALAARIGNAINVTNARERGNGFQITGTTGSPGAMVRHARVDLAASIAKDKGVARIVINGHSRIAASLLAAYSFLFAMVLLAGLLPGSIASGEDSGPMDAMVFLVFGIFIFYDINKKLVEPKEHLQSALDSLDTEFG